MDVRRFYVISPRGERGPFSVEELHEELAAGRITSTQQVRTGMGTMLGSVREVINTPEVMWNTADSGSGMSPVAMAQRRNRNLSLIILGLTLVPALAAIAFFGIGTTTMPVSANQAAKVPQPPPRNESPIVVTAPSRPPATTATSTATPTSTPASTTAPSKPAVFANVPDPLTATAQDHGPIRQAADGTVMLSASTATITTKGARLAGKGSADAYITSWNDDTGGVEWNAKIDHPGSFLVTITYACNQSGAGSELSFRADDHSVTDLTRNTGTWDDYKPHQLSQTLTISKAGVVKFSLGPSKKKSSAFMKLRHVVLTPVR